MDDDEPISDAEQTRAAALLRMTENVVAPASLHAAVHAMTEGAAPGGARRPSWRPRVLAPAGVALAAIVVAIVVVLAGGGTTPTVAQTVRLALAPATAPAPAVDVSDRTRLTVSEAGIAFPSYLTHGGWTPTGVRHDTLHGRAVTTVDYRSPQGTRIGYSIVGGAVLGYPRGTSTSSGGVRYVVAQAGGARVVTWWQDGHTCVIAGRSVSSRTLLGLARAEGTA